MPIDNSGNQLKPSVSELKVPEKKQNLGDKIRSILNRQTSKNPVETFHQLAELSVDHPTEDQLPSTPTIENTPPLVQPTSNSDQQEITQLSNAIKQESSQVITPETSTDKPHLFPNRPSLYDQHHQEYHQECRSLKGQIIRHKDIKILKKEGIDDAAIVYDALRARGISRDQIMQNDLKQRSRLSSEKNTFPWEETYQPISPQILPKMIDRLYQIYSFDPDFFTSDEKFKSLNDKAKEISVQTDDQFNQMYSQLNRYPFLHESSSVYQLFSKPDLPANFEFTLKFLQQSYFSNPDNIKKINSLLPKNPNIFRSLYYGSYLDIITAIAQSDINPDEKISLPEEIKQTDVWLKGFDNLSTRDYQRYFSSERRYFDKPDKWFDANNQPKIAFFEDFLRFTDITKPIKIPDQAINSIDNSELKAKWQFISSLPDISLQKYVNYLINPKQGYFYNGEADVYSIYRTLFSQRRILSIVQNHFSEFSSDTQEKIISAWVTNHLSRGNADNYISAQNDNPDISSGIKTILGNSESIDSFLNKDNLPTSHFFEVYIKNTDHTDIDQFLHSHLTQEIISSFSQEDQNFWQFSLSFDDLQATRFLVKNKADFNKFFQNGQPTSSFFENFLPYYSGTHRIDFLNNFLEIDALDSPLDQKMWQSILASKEEFSSNILTLIFNHKKEIDTFFDDQNNLTPAFFSSFNSSFTPDDYSFLKNKLNPEFISRFPSEDQNKWQLLSRLISTPGLDLKPIHLSFLFDKKNSLDAILKFYSKNSPDSFDKFLCQSATKLEWNIIFTSQVVNQLLDSLPKSTDEKRNAFTHNEYDRTSSFFEFLAKNSSSSFKLNQENLRISTEYIKNFGLSKSTALYRYFQTLSLYKAGQIPQLPEEFIQNHISSIEDLKQEVKKIQKICFSSEPLTNLSNLTPFQIESLSFATRHSIGRWTVIPIQTIISDFSQSLSLGEIKPLPDQFYPETMNANSIKIETDKKISDSPTLTVLKEEILRSITEGNDISSEKKVLTEIFNQRVSQLLSSNIGDNSKKQEYLQKQITAFTKEIELISSSDSVDSLLSMLIPLTLGLGTDQEKYNSVLRQLVFKKVFDKHQNSPEWKENIKNALEGTDTPLIINQISDLINNTIKDHVLNFETKNQDRYWGESTFEIVKKYSVPFKKNLSFQSFINELNSYRESFTITQLSQNQTITLIPDRGLIGEMSGYMAGVCYTKVYPLLKTYPDLIPYKFVANSQSENPEFIGSTLVFKVEDVNDQPVFLIRAFDIPDEQSVDIGKFFESFIDHLTPIAKKMGIKKIITAGTSGTISNYSTTNNYVINKYVTDQQNVPLKNTFNFNGYDITQQCYLVRNL